MPSREEFAAALLEAATQALGEVPEGVSEDWDLREDLGADSLDLLEIVMVLEEDFDFTVEEDLRGGHHRRRRPGRADQAIP